LDAETIIAELEAERDRLDQAIAALRRAGNGKARIGRRGHRRLSAAARRRISEGMKKKWAARKKAGAA
jgi:exonuclease VII small subunit